MFPRPLLGPAWTTTRGLGARPRERRRQRSQQLYEALRLQLRHTQERLALDALVLTDDLGEILASAGRSELVREVAVQSPWLAATSAWDLDGALAYLWKIYPGLKSDRFCVRQVALEGFDEPLILCGIGRRKGIDTGVSHAAAGVQRILRKALD